MGAPQEKDAGPVWPPRDVTPRRVHPDLAGEGLELQIDESDPLPADPDFTPSRFAKHGIGRVGAGAEEEASQVVVFDPRNPSGRTRRDRVLDTNDDDFRQILREGRRKAFLTGVIAFGGMLAFFGHFHPTSWALGCAAGGSAGVFAHETRDDVVSWSLTMAALGVPIMALEGALFGSLVTAVLFVAGWIAGLVRESTR